MFVPLPPSVYFLHFPFSLSICCISCFLLKVSREFSASFTWMSTDILGGVLDMRLKYVIYLKGHDIKRATGQTNKQTKTGKGMHAFNVPCRYT